MDEHEWLAEQFEAERPHLRAVAYRMLGYAGLSPVVFLLLAKVLGRAESRSEEAARSLGPQLGT